MSTSAEIKSYNKNLSKENKAIALLLLELIEKSLSKAEGKVWHGHPVWFIDGNPIVGYSEKKGGVELLFWSGQSFESELLTPIGKFKAAGITFIDINEVKKSAINKVLAESKKIQWDYANLPKKKKLVKLTEF